MQLPIYSSLECIIYFFSEYKSIDEGKKKKKILIKTLLIITRSEAYHFAQKRKYTLVLSMIIIN